MQEHYKITCPCCDSILIVRRRDGAVIEVRKPLLEESTGDRFQDAFKKVKERGKVINSKIEEVKKIEEERRKGADDFFKEALKRAKETKDEKPVNPLDAD